MKFLLRSPTWCLSLTRPWLHHKLSLFVPPLHAPLPLPPHRPLTSDPMARRYKKFKLSEPSRQLPSIRLKIISMKETRKVHHWNISPDEARPGIVHINTVAGVSDGQLAYKFTLFKELAGQVEEGETYRFTNYTMAPLGSGRSILCTKHTQIYMCEPLTVPEEVEEEAKNLISPPSPQVALSAISEASEGLVSVEGSVTLLHPILEFFPPQGLPYPVRPLLLKEAETEIKVMLWQEANLTSLEEAMPIKISHMRAKNTAPYGMALHSTKHTEIQLFSGLVKIEVMGVRVNENHIELLDTSDIRRLISASMWASTFKEPVVTAVGKKLTLRYADGRVQEVLSVED